jgi:hypothetical protein
MFNRMLTREVQTAMAARAANQEDQVVYTADAPMCAWRTVDCLLRPRYSGLACTPQRSKYCLNTFGAKFIWKQ